MKKIIIIIAIILSGCAAQDSSNNPPVSTEQSGREAFLEKGYKHLSNRETKKAIEYFDKVIADCDAEYSNKENEVYAARSMIENVFYMMKAASEDKSAIAISTTCTDALYLKGYAAVDFGQIEQAETYLKRAVKMAPVNSMYLSELGHIYHAKQEWGPALETFLKSEEAARTYSPPSVKVRELTRAMRGVGYSFIELGRLDEAEKKFRECLKINAYDEMATKEIEYINHLRSNLPSDF